MELFLIALIAFEVLSGGFVTSAFAGAAVEGAKAAWGETSKGAKSWYGKRAKRMKKTRMGRWRLRTEATVAGGLAFLGRGVAAGAKAAPGGANKGRKARHAIRRKAVAKARAGGRQALATGGAKVAEWRTRGGRGGGPVADDGGAAGGQSGGSDGAPETQPVVDGGGEVAPKHCATRNCPRGAKSGPWCESCRTAMAKAADDHTTRAAADPCCSTWRDTGMGNQHAADCPDARPWWRRPGSSGADDPRVQITGETVHADDRTYDIGTTGKDTEEHGMHPGSFDAVRDADAAHPAKSRMQEIADAARAGLCPRCGGQAVKGHLLCQACAAEAGFATEEQSSQTTPPSGGGNTTNEGAGMAENRGVRPYLAIWEQAPEGLETTAASVQQRVDTLAAAAEANSVHEVGGIDAVVAAGEHAVEALRAFEEQVRVHQTALNEKWTPDVLAGLDATGAESGQELAGAH